MEVLRRRLPSRDGFPDLPTLVDVHQAEVGGVAAGSSLSPPAPAALGLAEAILGSCTHSETTNNSCIMHQFLE